MRPLWKDMLISLFMGMILPGVLLNGMAMVFPKALERDVLSVVYTHPESPMSMTVLVENADGTVETGDMDEYLVGVVLAEMPSYFEWEALKAQAVVARTYALKAFTTGGKHGNGSVCRASGCCQAWMSEQDYLAKGGTMPDLEKVRSAVAETAGYVLTYEGELIEATYFSCSGGTTEDAAAVWGTDFPYLRSVSSPGEENAAHYRDTHTFDWEVFCALLDVAPQTADLGQVRYTAGGGVETMVIGGKTFKGTELRKLLGLRSTAMTVNRLGDTVEVTTSGFGHRVGMSQYGADAMAVSGSTWREILAHYYPGTQVERWDAS